MPKLIVQEGYRQTREFNLPQGETRVGRSVENDLVLTSQGVSRRHILIRRDHAAVTIEDLASRNGTFLNSAPVTAAVQLKHMDMIQLGEAMIVYNEVATGGEEKTVSGFEEERVFDLAYLQNTVTAIRTNMAKVIRGKDDVIDRVILALLSDGHVLVEDVPGVGKTMLAQALAKSILTDYKRIQFTPDLLPTDITGVNVYDEQSREFVFIPGPVFANVVLADEINRGTPRTQSSLLESMAEAIVTVDGRAHVLPKPFFVIATQNPIDFHGTYPLPEAQLDRFLMRLRMGYPGASTEREILQSQVAAHPISMISYVARAADVLRCQALIKTVHVSEPVKDYIVTVVEKTRRHPALAYGASPRASLALMRLGQSRAAVQGRDYIMPRDVRDLAVAVLAHRLPLKLQARAEYENAERVVAEILAELPLEKWENES